MPPSQRKTTPSQRKAPAADEAQAATPMKADEVAHVNAPPAEPATGPDAPSGVAASDLAAASLAGLLGDLKAFGERMDALEAHLRGDLSALGNELAKANGEHSQLSQQMDEARDEFRNAMSGFTERQEIGVQARNILTDRLGELEQSLDVISTGLNERIGRLEVGPPAGVRHRLEALEGGLDALDRKVELYVDRKVAAMFEGTGVAPAEIASTAVGLDNLKKRVNWLTDRLVDTQATEGSLKSTEAINSAMWEIMKEVQGIGKHGVMAPEGGGYAFRKYDDLKREIGAACRRHGVMLEAQALERERERVGRMVYVTVKVAYRFRSLVDSSVVEFTAYGEGSSTTDKATGKAMTMALKSALDQAFLLAAEDIEDPDATNEEPPQEHRVGDQVTVASQTFAKHSDGPALPDTAAPSYPAADVADDPWQKPLPEREQPPKKERTPEEAAQSAVDALNRPGLTMERWTAISAHAQELGLFDVVVRTPDGSEMALKLHLVAVGRTL